MHFREQFYGYYEGLDMAMAWYAAGAPHGVKTYNQIVEKFGLGASRDFLKEADPFHDAESDEEYWTRVEGAFRLIADNPNLKDGDDVLQISHGNTLLSLGHRFGGPDLDLNERPATEPLAGYLRHPAALARLSGDFLTQFFYYEGGGPAIMAVVLLLWGVVVFRLLVPYMGRWAWVPTVLAVAWEAGRQCGLNLSLIHI